MKKTLLAAALALVLGVALVSLHDQPAEAAIVLVLPPIPCSIVLCVAPDCPAGTKAVILPGDCCFTCVPTR